MKLEKYEIDESDPWEKLYAKDLAVIGNFVRFYPANKKYRLIFSDGTQIIAKYDGGGEGENDLELNDPFCEDWYEVYFYVEKIEKKGSEWNFKEGELFFLNYHNFFVEFEPIEEEDK